MTTDLDAWRKWRRSGIGASDVAAIAGLSPWSTPMSVWVSKVMELPDEQTETMEWGHLLEPVITQKFVADTGLIVDGAQSWCTHPDYPHHLATVDGFVLPTKDTPFNEATGVLEVKTTGDFPWLEIPDTYAIQVQWQLHVTGLDRAWVAVLHMARGRAFRVHEIERNQETIDVLVRIVERFWSEFVEGNQPPPADGEEESTRALRARWPNHVEGSKVELDPETVDEFWARKETSDEAAKALEETKQNICRAMGEAEVATVDGQVAFTWRQSGKSRRFLPQKRKELVG